MSESQPGQPSARPLSDAAEAARATGKPAGRAVDAPFVLSQEPVTDAAIVPAPGGNGPAPPSTPAPAYEHLGELPSTYGTQSVYLVAYDPKQLFVYWDIDWATLGGTSCGLHVCRADGQIESEITVYSTDAGRYLPAGVRGGTYYVELGTRGRNGSWNPLAHSGRVTLPPEGLAGEDEPKFATLPFHLSFQRLLELIQGAMGKEENLTAALSRLQDGDHADIDRIASAIGGLGPDQLFTLEALLGQKFSVSSLGDVDSTGLLRDRATVLGATAFSSEELSSGSLARPGAGGSETLSSGMLARGAVGSEMLSSAGLVSPIGGLRSESLSSGAFGSGESLRAFAAGMSSETLSSFGGPGGASGSEAWRLVGSAGHSSSDLAASEGVPELQRAIEHNLRILGALFSAVNASLGGGTGGASDVSSPGS